MTVVLSDSSKPEALAAFFAFDEAQMRELVIEALRLWHQQNAARLHVSMHGDLGRCAVQIVEWRTGRKPGLDYSEAFCFGAEIETDDRYRWRVYVCEAMEWLTRAGFVTPVGSEANRYPIRYRITLAGARFLEAADDHPLLPGFVDRVRTRCPGLPDGVLALLVDAQACLDHMLLRPAVAVMGLAYEAAIEAVAENLIGRNGLPMNVREQRAARRIASVRGVIDTQFPGDVNRDLRGALHQAADFSDALRRRRNDASHTTSRYDFSDRAEIEELIVSAGRHLPNLWRFVTG